MLAYYREIKCLGAHGEYVEYILADENICFKLPTDITLEQAVTMPLIATTLLLA